MYNCITIGPLPTRAKTARRRPAPWMFGGLLGVFAGPSFECELRGFPVSVIKRDDLETGSRRSGASHL